MQDNVIVYVWLIVLVDARQRNDEKIWLQEKRRVKVACVEVSETTERQHTVANSQAVCPIFLAAKAVTLIQRRLNEHTYLCTSRDV
ncbi:hypothetical protein M513_13275, partial [Trichuris suis]